ncbi:transcription activator GAGA-like [Cydia strobilella]|uniref:transcription activator GAGA-like n=1 Tax=Cydia strobilella TaxID=1100964 RepID=UPI003003FC8A
MVNTQFALSWEAHKKNVCNGLSSLQQNGEFVDMTLAADGHMVKVHQIVMALASPYIKDLIASAQCPHPVIFLNRISYSTLCLILEYIYTGEVLVNSEDLNQLIEAGNELHIKGLEDMKMSQSASSNRTSVHYESNAQSQNEDEDVCFFEISDIPEKDSKYQIYTKNMNYEEKECILGTIDNVKSVDESFMELQEDMESNVVAMTDTDHKIDTVGSKNTGVMQYTVSNQGSLQMILNRYVYYLKHTNRNNSRQWRCVDYVTSMKCPAHVVTKDDVVVQRIAAHIHPFHDKKILKKVHAGSIFSAIHEAEKQGNALVGNKRAKLALATEDWSASVVNK